MKTKVGEVKIRYSPRKGGNPHLIRDIWAKCPDCGKERWTDQKWFIRNNSLGLCRSCSHRRANHNKLYIPFEQRQVLKRPDGYLYVHLPINHWAIPMSAKHGRSYGCLLHRLIMAEYLGRLLKPNEVVHHINGIHDDNRIENLHLTVRGKHKLSYRDGYSRGFREGLAIRDKELEKQIKLLRWQIKELGEALQLRMGSSL